MRTISALTMIAILSISSLAMAVWTPYTEFNSPLETNDLSCLTVSPGGKLLIGTNGRGLFVKDSLDWQVFNYTNTGVPINYTCNLSYAADTLFIGSASRNLDIQPVGEGLSILNLPDSTWGTLNAGLGISPVITGIEITPNYRAVSTYGGGVTIFNDAGWTRYQNEFRTEFSYADSQQQTYKVDADTYIPTDYIRGLDYDDVSNTLWIATLDGGAVAYDGTSWYAYNLSNSGLPSNRIQLIKADPATGSVYFGTYGFGLAQKSGSQWIVYNTRNSPIVSNYIYSLEIRPDNGDLWIGTGYGISVISPDCLWMSYIASQDTGLVWADYYSGIAFDSSGNVWVSTFGGGMSSMALDIEVDPDDPDDPDDPVYDSLFVDVKKLKILLRESPRNDIIWIKAHLEPGVELEPDDTVSATVLSTYGVVYHWQATFDQFQCVFNWGNNEIYLGILDGSAMTLWYQHNQDRIKLFHYDYQPEINRDNLDYALSVRVRLGNYAGCQLVYVGEADPLADPDADTLEYQEGDILLSNDYFPLITGVDDTEPIQPSTIAIPFNYPNPFNPITTIAFSTDYPAAVYLDIYDVLGRQVTSIENYFDSGVHEIDWDGSGKPSGVYYYILRYDNNLFKGRMTLLK